MVQDNGTYCRYVADATSKTVTELLDDEPKLLRYAQQLEEAELNAELVSELSLAELREVLNGAPIAHCLKLRQRMVASTKMRAVIPDAATLKWQARMVATGVLNGNLKEAAFSQHECDLVMGSLFLSFLVGETLATPTACGDGSACSGLLAADMLCWTFLTTCVLLGVVNSWSMMAIERCVSSDSMPRWICDNWLIYQGGAALAVVAFTFLPVALSVRAIILLSSPSYPSWLVWVVVAILLGGGIVIQYMWWAVICSRTFTITSPSQFLSFNLGVLGVPTQLREGAPIQEEPAYFAN